MKRQLLTTGDVAAYIGRGIDHTRKLLQAFEPVEVIGNSKFWTKAQADSLKKQVAK